MLLSMYKLIYCVFYNEVKKKIIMLSMINASVKSLLLLLFIKYNSVEYLKIFCLIACWTAVDPLILARSMTPDFYTIYIIS